MLSYILLTDILKVYGQDEVDVGIESDNVDNTVPTGVGGGGGGGGDGGSSVIEDQSESISSLQSQMQLQVLAVIGLASSFRLL